MKILQLNSVYNFGSTGRIVKDLHYFFQNEGFSSYVIYGRGEKSNDDNVFLIENKSEMMSHILLTRTLDRHGFGSKKNTSNIINKIREISPEMILLHNIHGYFVNVEMLFDFFRDANIKILWLLHDTWPVTGHSAFLDFTNESKTELDYSYDKKNVYPKTYLLKQTKRNLRDKERVFSSINNLTIITPSNWLQDVVSRTYLNRYKIKTIYNGIDTNLFNVNTNKSKKDKNKKIILGVTNYWTPLKGLDIFNQLADLVSDKYEIVLIGVDKKVKKKINTKIETIYRTENINELVNYYNLASLFINPTFQDNFPTTNLEALCCGTPVITFKTGGSPEAIDSNSGLVTEQKTSHSLLKAVEQLSNNQNISTESCRKRGELFSKKNMHKAYLELINNIMEE